MIYPCSGVFTLAPTQKDQENMSNQFLINYIQQQFGFIPAKIPASWQFAALKAYESAATEFSTRG